MKTQAQALEEFSVSELMLATVKYDELMQTIAQNFILVKDGFWTKKLCDMTDQEIYYYVQHRQQLIDSGYLDENAIRIAAINFLKNTP